MAAIASTVAAPVVHRFQESAEAFREDPWGMLQRSLNRVGFGFVVGGFLMGTVGYFTKAQATAAQNNLVGTLSNMGTIFSNIRQPTFKPAATGTAPVSASLQGVQNFFSDAGRDLLAAAGDIGQVGGVLGTLAEDVGAGLVDLAKVGLSFVTHFPSILWDSLMWSIGGGLANLFLWAFPWLVILGAGMLVLSAIIAVARRFWKRFKGRLILAVNARTARWWNAFDRWWGTRSKIQAVWTQKSTEGAIHSANAEPLFVPPEPKLPPPAAGDGKEERQFLKRSEAEQRMRARGESEEVIQRRLERIGPESKVSKAGVAERRILEPTPTEEVQRQLGEGPEAPVVTPPPEKGQEGPSREPTSGSTNAETVPPEPKEPTEGELAEAEQNRIASLPTGSEESRSYFTGQSLSYRRQLRAERYQAAAEASVRGPALKGQAIALTPQEIMAASTASEDPTRRRQLEEASLRKTDRLERAARRERIRSGEYRDLEAEAEERKRARAMRQESWTRTLAMSGEEGPYR